MSKDTVKSGDADDPLKRAQPGTFKTPEQKAAEQREAWLKLLPDGYENMPDGYWALKKRVANAIQYAPKYGREEDVLVLLNLLHADANARLKPLLEDEDHG